jgi:hypothetical protein
LFLLHKSLLYRSKAAFGLRKQNGVVAHAGGKLFSRQSVSVE